MQILHLIHVKHSMNRAFSNNLFLFSIRILLVNKLSYYVYLLFQNNTIIVRELENKLLMCQNAKPSSQLSADEVDGLRKDRDRQCKEIVILRKTIEEMEIRISTQKQTLIARDESIKKLLEMLQSKGLSTSQIDNDRKEIENLRSRVYECDCRLQHLDYVVEQKDKELSISKEV